MARTVDAALAAELDDMLSMLKQEGSWAAAVTVTNRVVKRSQDSLDSCGRLD